MNKIVIWRDTVDQTQFFLGVQLHTGICVAWCAIYIDGISDLFGNVIGAWAQALRPGIPTPVSVCMEVSE